MYHIRDMQESLGQVHNLGKGKGYHFTWCIYPLYFARFYHDFISVSSHVVIDEYGNGMSLLSFISIVEKSSSVSFDERIV